MNTIHEQDGKTVVLLLSWRDIRSPKSGEQKFLPMKCLNAHSKDVSSSFIFHPNLRGCLSMKLLTVLRIFEKGTYTVLFIMRCAITVVIEGRSIM